MEPCSQKLCEMAASSELSQRRAYYCTHGRLVPIAPQNVLVDSRFRAKVADFGISAKQKSRAGTPYWMAPELLKGARISTAGDVSWSLP